MAWRNEMQAGIWAVPLLFLSTLSNHFVLVGCKAPEHVAEERLIVDSAYLKRLRTFAADNGTIHVFLKNLDSQPIEVQDGSINDILLSNQEAFLWHRIHPNPIPSMEVAELIVRLRQPLVSSPESKGVKLHLTTTSDEKISTWISDTNPPLHLTFVGFSDSLDTVFLYAKNSGKRTLSIDKIFLSIEDVTPKCRIPNRKLSHNEKKLVVMELDEPFTRGQYITVKITTKEGMMAQSKVRAFSDFPLVGLDIKRNVELFMDNIEYDWQTDGKNPNSVAYHVLDCPMHRGRDHSIEAVFLKVKDLFSRVTEMEKINPCVPGYVHICRFNIYQACADFGQITDFIRINPSSALHPMFSRLISHVPSPDEIDSSLVQHLTAVAKEGCEPRPLHTSIGITSGNNEDINVSPRLARLTVYDAISRGSKGLCYRAVGDSLDDRLGLKQEIKKIAGELQVLKRFLKISEPMPLSESTNPNVKANSLLCGNKAVLLLLLNHKPVQLREMENGKTFNLSLSHFPEIFFEITVYIPQWMQVQDVYEVGGNYERLKYKQRGNRITIKIDRLDVTKQILLTTRANDYDHDQDKDGISDIDEILVHNTHPAIPNIHPASQAATD